MDSAGFARLPVSLTRSAEDDDGFAAHFADDAVYYDFIYGAHTGRADIANP